jgi:entericidin B
MLPRLLAALMILGMLGTLPACNTIEGVGKDIERGGDKLQDKARDTQRKM